MLRRLGQVNQAHSARFFLPQPFYRLGLPSRFRLRLLLSNNKMPQLRPAVLRFEHQPSGVIPNDEDHPKELLGTVGPLKAKRRPHCEVIWCSEDSIKSKKWKVKSFYVRSLRRESP
jgi:hypothetical protein